MLMAYYQNAKQVMEKIHYSLVSMFEKWGKHLDKGGWRRGLGRGALFIDLSKPFDSLQQELLLAKLNAYGFSYKLLKIICYFSSERRSRITVNSEYSDWEDLMCHRDQYEDVIYLTSICAIFFF